MWLLKRGENTSSLPVMEDSSSDRDVETELGVRHWLLILMHVVSLVIGTIFLNARLPEAQPASTDNNRFSELRARRLVFEMSNFGPKPAGSEACELYTKGYILNEIGIIKVAATAKIEISLQNPSGCFDIPRFDTDSFTVCYKNVSNVAVRLSRNDTKEQRFALLLNCHYDSWPVSSGGSDDLASCAIMLELLRLLSQKMNVLKHDVIFLFNGAEESSLQGAHGFITQHPWRHLIRAFINLEASGSGGRELLFQAGPANQWLLNSYLESATHPHCSIIAQEVFQSGLFPGETDFRVFRDYGRIPGLDLAFVQNGYWWHTEFDEGKRIAIGSIQRAGDNVYATVLHLLQSPNLSNPAGNADQKYVFFDFLGLFVVVYSDTIGNALNAIFAITSLVKAGKHIRNESGECRAAVTNYAIVFVTMSVLTFALTQLTLLIWGAMPWYSIHAVAVVIYAMPVVWAGLGSMAFLAAKIEPVKREDHARAIETVHRTMVAVIVCFLTLKGVSSSFIFTLMLIPLAGDVIHFKNEWVVVLTHIVLHTPSYGMAIYLSSMVQSIIIPIMGRTGTNPEVLVAVMTNFSTYIIVFSLLPLVTITALKRTQAETTLWNFFGMISGILLTVSAVLAVLHFLHKSPYSYTDEYPMPRRVQVFHVNRVIDNRNQTIQDSALYVIAQDYRGAEDIPFVDRNYSKVECLDNGPYCEIPLYFPTRHRIQERHIRYKTVGETLALPDTKVTLIHKLEDEKKIVYDFVVKGSNQVSVYVVPQKGWRIANCTLSAPRKELDERPLFLFFTCSGDKCSEFWFQITIVQPGEPTSDEDSQLLLGVASHYLYGKYMQSHTIRRLLAEITKRRQDDPAWAIAASAWNVDMIYRYY
ncbi:hypothetical protein V3C99_012038 [Haemonchus contortus]